MTDLSIYIHIPFCKSKCKYCDFLSEGIGDCPTHLGTVPGAYIDALCRDIITSAGDFADYRVVTVFFGGGTPSLLTPPQLERVVGCLWQHFNFASDCILSIEANPDAVDIHGLIGARFKRVSFGVQSFNDAHLRAIGRRHSSWQAEAAVLEAYAVGLEDINIDLMFALPNQTLEDFGESLDIAINLPITHISCYALTIEEGTPMAGHVTDENLDRQMYALAQKKLADAGFVHYEVSNWARPGRECVHNVGYWTGREYLGLGLGASSYFNNKRMKKTDNLDDYIGGNFEFELIEDLSVADQMSEYVILGLRMTRGISITGFESRFGEDIFEVFGKPIKRFLSAGLLTQNGDKIALTSRGMDLANTVYTEFL
ncbi:MAG: radical SAM family heme chaperone HemW [Defluviitaleaceae bacterium]|nr:radical SAM family heme chaperone HemW [Defluviitaleaceae bacterium]